MELVTRNVLRHVYEALQDRRFPRRLSDMYSDNTSNLQLFYNRVMSEYSSVSAEKKAQPYLVVPGLFRQDVDDFHKMSQEDFIEIFRTKVRYDCLTVKPLYNYYNKNLSLVHV